MTFEREMRREHDILIRSMQVVLPCVLIRERPMYRACHSGFVSGQSVRQALHAILMLAEAICASTTVGESSANLTHWLPHWLLHWLSWSSS